MTFKAMFDANGGVGFPILKPPFFTICSAIMSSVVVSVPGVTT